MALGQKAASAPPPHDAATATEARAIDFGRHPSPKLNPMERLMNQVPDGYIVPLAGGLAGTVSGIVSCPLDVIKTKLQAQGGFQARKGRALPAGAYSGVTGTARTIWIEEGLRGMYRGLGPMLLGYIPTWAVYLTTYNEAQAFFQTRTENRFMANVYASIVGGTCSTLATNPIWVIKTRLMSQSSTSSVGRDTRAPWHYRNTLDAARKMYGAEGIKSFYSGLTPALLGLTHVAIQFPLYEYFKVKLTGLNEGQIGEETLSAHFYHLSLAVFFSKLIASTATYPHEVVRTRMQTQQRSSSSLAANSNASNLKGSPTQLLRAASEAPNGLRYRSTFHTCQTIFLEEGWRGFYAGLGTNLIRAVPAAMTTILTFEYLKKAMLGHRESAKARLGNMSR